MTVFVDASALTAIIVREPDFESLVDILEADEDRLCSATSLWETVAGLVHSYAFPMDVARERARIFRTTLGLRLVPIGEVEFDLAVEAYARFGKGRHPAALNMGDCHAYACARAHGAALLFKGNDFSKTDVPQATDVPQTGAP